MKPSNWWSKRCKNTGKTLAFLNQVHPLHLPPSPIHQRFNQNSINTISNSSVVLDSTVTVAAGKWNYDDILKISPRIFQRPQMLFNGGQSMQGSIPHLHKLPRTSVPLVNNCFLLLVKLQLIDIPILAQSNLNTFKFSNMLGENISSMQQATILQR